MPMLRRIWVCGLAACVIGLTPFPSAVASPTDAPQPTWITNGTVWASAAVGSTLYLGGGFSELSPPTGGALDLDAATGILDPSKPEVTGAVHAVRESPSGGWYVGGSFTAVGGAKRRGLAAIRADGQVFAWNPKVRGGTVNALALSPDGGTLYVGGSFTALAGQPRAGLAAISTATNSLTAWDPGTSGGAVEALAVSADGRTVFAGGSFAVAGGAARSRIAAINAETGAARAWNPGANAAVHALEVAGGVVYAGGAFTVLGGAPFARLGAVATGSGTPPAWTGTGTDADVHALALIGNMLYVGGDQTSLDGQPRPFLGAVSATTGVAAAWSPVPDGPVHALRASRDGTVVFAAGTFTSIGTEQIRRLASVDAVTGVVAAGWAPNPNLPVDALATSTDGTRVFAGGSFTGAGGVLRDRLAAIDLVTGQPTDWSPGANKTVYALAASPDGTTIFAGGVFTHVGGKFRNRLVAIEAATADVRTTFQVGASSRVRSLAVLGDVLYVGGEFAKLGGQDRPNLGAVRISTETLEPWRPAPDGMIRSIWPTADRVYVGGDFSTIAGVERDHLAAVSASTGALVWAFAPPGPRYRTFQLASDGVRIFAAMGGPGGGRLRAYAADSGALAWEAAADGDVQACASADGLVYIGGHFDALLSQKRGSLGAVDAVNGALDPWNPRANDSIWNLEARPGLVVASGAFTRIGTQARHGVAAFG